MRYLSDRIRACRKNAGLNQSDFAALGGVAIGAQQRYEAGSAEPGASYFAGLHLAGIDILWLITGSRSSDALSERETELITYSRTMSDDFVDALLGLVRASAAGSGHAIGSPGSIQQTPPTLHDRKIDYRPD